ncbi:MAG: hypothetical protein HY881_23010 [Deltaproteobacteria bacterium]|nr:hypothetical protein [Deltaproteobacteria bacterium]
MASQKIRREVLPELEAELEKSREEIAALLTPEKTRKLDQNVKKLRHRVQEILPGPAF